MVCETFDQLLKKIIGFGPFQITIGLLIYFSQIASCGNSLIMSFLGLEFVQDFSENGENCSLVYENMKENGSIPELKGGFFSIIPQWDLICGDAYKVNMAASIGIAGEFFGGTIGGHISDTFGRKWVMYFAHFLLILFGLSSAFSPSWLVYCILKFLSGLNVAILYNSTFVYMQEVTHENHRLLMYIFGTWPIQTLLLTGVAYATRHWQTLTITMNLITSPLLVLFLFFPESPRWLVQQNRLEEARNSLQKMARWNRKTLEGLQHLDLRHLVQTKTKSISFVQFFKINKLYTLTLMLSGAVAMLAAIMFNFGVGNMYGSVYMNVALMAGIRFWLPIIVALSERYLPRFGRRQLFQTPMVMILGSFLAIILIGVFHPSSPALKELQTVLFILSAIACTFLFSAVSMFIVELYPTTTRSLAFGIIYGFGSASGILAPQLLFLEKFWEFTPFVVVSVLCALSFLLGCLFLPDTKGKPLPEVAAKKPSAVTDRF